jgi:hypothetical protein
VGYGGISGLVGEETSNTVLVCLVVRGVLDMRNAVRIIKVMVSACGMLALVTAACNAAEFRADVTTTFPGPLKNGKLTSFTIPGKIYVKGKSIRYETSIGEMSQAVIEPKVGADSWVLFPGQKTCFQAKAPNGTSPLSQFRWKASGKSKKGVKHLGSSGYSGYKCEKYLHILSKGEAVEYWTSRKLGVAVRMENKSKYFPVLMEVKNIQRMRLSDSLFRVPDGYKKLHSMPIPPKGPSPGIFPMAYRASSGQPMRVPPRMIPTKSMRPSPHSNRRP